MKKPAAAALNVMCKRHLLFVDESNIHDLLRLSMTGWNTLLGNVFIVHLGSLKEQRHDGNRVKETLT